MKNQYLRYSFPIFLCLIGTLLMPLVANAQFGKSISIQGGNNQTGTVGKKISQFAVRVTDRRLIQQFRFQEKV